MGRIKARQVRVFAMFAAAFVLAAYTSAFQAMHQPAMALMTGLLSLAFITMVWLEGYRS